MKTSNLASFALVLGSSLLTAAACGGTGTTGDGSDSAEAAVDSSDSTQAEGDLVMASMDGAQSTGAFAAPTGAGVAATIAANIAARWPGGCAVATATGANVAITYTHCSGPRGLLDVTGELDLAVSVSLAGELSVHATATDLAVNQATMTVDATGVYTRSGTTNQLVVTSHGSGTGPRGNSIDHDGSYTIAWDSATLCHSIDGAWSTELSNGTGAVSRSNTVSLDRCPGMCPTGDVTHKFVGGAALTITFDGTAVATWSVTTGASGTVQLTCGN